MKEVTLVVKYDKEIADFKVCLIDVKLDIYEKTKLSLRLDCVDFFIDEKMPDEYNEIYFLTCPIFVDPAQIEEEHMLELVEGVEM